VITCPLGRVKRSDHPLMAVDPVFVMVRSAVRPVFQALTATPTRQLDVAGDELLAGLLAGGDPAGELDAGPLDGKVPWNWARNRNASAEVQVRAPLVPVEPSTGLGVWSPSKAAHWTGNPARQPV